MGLFYLMFFASLAPCRGEQLDLRIASQDVATPRRELTMAIKNQGKTACTLDGFATIRLLDRDQKPIAVEVRHNQNDPLFGREKMKRVRLNPGEEASFYLGYAIAPPGQKECTSTAKIEASAPGGGKPMSVNASINPCGALNISPILEGVINSSKSPNFPAK